MRPFSSPRWTRCLQVSRMALVIPVTLASLQLLAHAQGKGPPVEYPTFYRTIQIDGLSIFTERPARKTRRRFSCCTDFPLHRGCTSLYLPGFPIAITLSRRITPGFGHSDWPDPKK